MKCKCLIVCFALVLAICSGCFFDYQDEDIPFDHQMMTEEPDYDTSRFFVEKVEYPECNFYVVCYENPDGEITEVVEMGMRNTQFVIANDRIFFADGLNIISVDLTGNERQTFYDHSGNGVTFEEIIGHDDEWLYCYGRKSEEIYGDPVAVDGPHMVAVYTRVKIDFSEFQEVG